MSNIAVYYMHEIHHTKKVIILPLIFYSIALIQKLTSNLSLSKIIELINQKSVLISLMLFFWLCYFIDFSFLILRLRKICNYIMKKHHNPHHFDFFLFKTV
jgi:hypothetical protein